MAPIARAAPPSRPRNSILRKALRACATTTTPFVSSKWHSPPWILCRAWQDRPKCDLSRGEGHFDHSCRIHAEEQLRLSIMFSHSNPAYIIGLILQLSQVSITLVRNGTPRRHRNSEVLKFVKGTEVSLKEPLVLFL